MDSILLSHGSGGRLSHELISELIVAKLGNPTLNQLQDSAVLDLPPHRLAFTTDSYVIDPIFFPGGDIGKLAVCGTINDLAVVGAEPKFISCALIIEEGMSIDSLSIVLDSIAEYSRKARVQVVTGDTKVVDKGKADAIFINTAGIGSIMPRANLGFHRIESGDRILINGTIGDHGIAVLSKRKGIDFDVPIVSDCAPLNDLISILVAELGDALKFMRDPTRGGLATTLKEIAESTDLEIDIDESSIPISDEVSGACEILGIDPLLVANEGKFVAVVAEDHVDDALALMKSHELGKDAALIGDVRSGKNGQVFMRTAIGTSRVVDMLVGGQLPRIC